MKDPNISDEERKKIKLLEKKWLLNIYENEFLPFHKKMSASYQNKIEFRWGLFLGLILGIVGNVFVQFSYTFIEKIVLHQHDEMYYVSFMFVMISLAAIVYSIYKFDRLQKSDFKGVDAYDDGRFYYERKIEQLKLEIEAEEMGLFKKDK